MGGGTGAKAFTRLPRKRDRQGVDKDARIGKESVMRTVSALGLLTLLAACSGTPASYGITGPGTQPPPAAVTVPSPDTSPTPGMSTTGTSYGHSSEPSTGSSGFWGYN
jgi:hypothetical protein